jgi:hypothetical protein
VGTGRWCDEGLAIKYLLVRCVSEIPLRPSTSLITALDIRLVVLRAPSNRGAADMTEDCIVLLVVYCVKRHV